MFKTTVRIKLNFLPKINYTLRYYIIRHKTKIFMKLNKYPRKIKITFSSNFILT